MSSEKDGFGGKFFGLQIGVVEQNDDPLGLGRVRARIPGVVQLTPWAPPLGAPGGGTRRRGWYDPPDVGADVGVLFKNGEPDVPYYLAAAWGAPDGHKETPGPVGGYATPNHDTSPGTPEDIDPKDAHLVKAYETGSWVMIFDDRPGKERFLIENKKSGDHLLLDGANHRAELRVTSLLRVVVDGILRMEGASVTVNDRPVLGSGKGIF